MDQAANETYRKQQLQAIITDLQSSEEVVLNAALDKVTELGDVSVVPHLIHLVIHLEPGTVREKAKKLLFNAKHPDTLKLIFRELKGDVKEQAKAELIQAVWEGGHPAEDYLEDLVSISLTGDYLTCIEVLSVIDTMENLSEDRVKATSIDLKNHIDNNPSDKDALYAGMIESLTNQLVG